MGRRASISIVAVLLFSALLVPLASAQQPAGSEAPQDARVADDESDVIISSAAGNQPPPAGDFSRVDLVGAWIGAETEETVQFGYQTKSMNPLVGPADWFQRPAVFLYFTREDVQYRIAHYGTRTCGADGALQFFDLGVQFWRTTSCLRDEAGLTEIDTGAATALFTVPKEALVDQDHVPLRYDDELVGFYAESQATIVSGTSWFNWLPAQVGGVYARDRAPDSGNGPVFRSVLGTTGAGHLHLFSPEPMRVSNGEATTIVYLVHVVNQGEKEDEVLLSVQNAESSWDVRVPQRLTVPPESHLEFPVILSMEFTHRHGEAATFKVKAESASVEGAWSIVELGVFWTEIPQPAGHHDTIWFHSAQRTDADNPVETAFFTAYEFREVWMNPLPPGEDPDPDADEGDVPAYFNTRFFPGGNAAGNNVATWDFPLSPGLLIGLDFDLSRSGGETSYFKTVLRSQAPSQTATMAAELRYCDVTQPRQGGGGGGGQGGGNSGCPGQWVPIAYGSSETVALAANSAREFVIPLSIDSKADLIPYRKEANLRFHVEVVSDTPQNVNAPAPAPRLVVKDSEMVLPLIEYHDPINQAFEDVGSLKLTPLSDFERKVNPGKTTHFRFTLENQAEREQKVFLQIEGVNSEWAHYLEGEQMVLAAGQKKNLTLQVLVPQGAVGENRAELFVIVQNADDPNVVAVSRVRATVVDPSIEEIKDEAGLYSADVDASSPSVGLGVLLAGLVGVAVALRRRRD